MASHDTLFAAKDVRRTEDGLVVPIHLPWYRSLWLSCVDGLEVRVDGRSVPQDQVRFRLQDVTYRIEELPAQAETLWFLQDLAEVLVSLDDVPAGGRTVRVEVVLDVRLLYMQIEPGRYVGNRVAVEEEVTLV